MMNEEGKQNYFSTPGPTEAQVDSSEGEKTVRFGEVVPIEKDSPVTVDPANITDPSKIPGSPLSRHYGDVPETMGRQEGQPTQDEMGLGETAAKAAGLVTPDVHVPGADVIPSAKQINGQADQ